MSGVPTAIFEQYGDDAAAALQAFANVDNAGWSTYTDEAAEIRYRQDYAKWRRSITRSAKAEAVKADSGQVRLFEPPESQATIALRTRVVWDGEEHYLAMLRGRDGADVIRKVAQRDLAPAKTTVARCRNLLGLADHMEAETVRLGRPASAGEVLGWSA